MARFRAHPAQVGARAAFQEGTTTWLANQAPAPSANSCCSTSIYEDGTQRSNRRVPASALGGLDGDEPAKAIIAEQDAEIAEKSGQPRGPIKSIRRAGEPEPRSLQKSEREARQ